MKVLASKSTTDSSYGLVYRSGCPSSRRAVCCSLRAEAVDLLVCSFQCTRERAGKLEAVSSLSHVPSRFIVVTKSSYLLASLEKLIKKLFLQLRQQLLTSPLESRPADAKLPCKLAFNAVSSGIISKQKPSVLLRHLCQAALKLL